MCFSVVDRCTLLFLIFVAFHNSHSLGADAGEETSDDAAAAADSEEDPGDEVVDVHEVAGAVLEEGVLSGESFFPNEGLLCSLIRGDDVTGGVLASSAESPDHAGDPPGEATATGSGESKTNEGRSSASGNKTTETAEDTEAARGEGLDESPKEPSDKLAVDIVERLCTCFHGSVFGLVQIFDSCDNTVPSIRVGVGQTVLAQEGNKGDDTSAAGETTAEGDGHGGAAAIRNGRFVIVELVHFTFFGWRSFRL